MKTLEVTSCLKEKESLVSENIQIAVGKVHCYFLPGKFQNRILHMYKQPPASEA